MFTHLAPVHLGARVEQPASKMGSEGEAMEDDAKRRVASEASGYATYGDTRRRV
jgi:hypothetical protein